jgi:4-hydroxybenzoate polyprenyltransferase
MLVLRLMDELKDQEVDQALFRERPLPSGRIHPSDIVVTLWVAIALFLAPNLTAVTTAIAAVLLLGWALLMFRWFFIREIMRPNLPLTLVTHNPVVPLMLLNLVVVAAHDGHVPLSRVRWGPTALFVAMVWASSFAWEIARKIRSSGEENAYVTYSRLLGRGGAVALAAAAQTGSLVIGLWLWRAMGLHAVFAAILGVAWVGTMAMHARFLFAPGPAASRLRRTAEAHALAVLLATIAGCWLEVWS